MPCVFHCEDTAFAKTLPSPCVPLSLWPRLPLPCAAVSPISKARWPGTAPTPTTSGRTRPSGTLLRHCLSLLFTGRLSPAAKLDAASKSDAFHLSPPFTVVLHCRSGSYTLRIALVRNTSDGIVSRRRDGHSADALSPSLLKHLLKAEGGAAE